MIPNPVILLPAQAKFPPSANKQVKVASAWRISDSTLDWPALSGSDGWTWIGKFATREVLQDLHEQGYTWVSLETGGTRKPPQHARVTDLL